MTRELISLLLASPQGRSLTPRMVQELLSQCPPELTIDENAVPVEGERYSRMMTSLKSWSEKGVYWRDRFADDVASALKIDLSGGLDGSTELSGSIARSQAATKNALNAAAITHDCLSTMEKVRREALKLGTLAQEIESTDKALGEKFRRRLEAPTKHHLVGNTNDLDLTYTEQQACDEILQKNSLSLRDLIESRAEFEKEVWDKLKAYRQTEQTARVAGLTAAAEDAATNKAAWLEILRKKETYDKADRSYAPSSVMRASAFYTRTKDSSAPTSVASNLGIKLEGESDQAAKKRIIGKLKAGMARQGTSLPLAMAMSDFGAFPEGKHGN
jgi:hypothetical protein